MCDSDCDRRYEELREDYKGLRKENDKLEKKYNKIFEENEDLLEKIELLEYQIEFFKNKRKQSNKHIKTMFHMSQIYQKIHDDVKYNIDPDKLDDFLEDIKNGKYKNGKYNL